jgi:hypothetical protein
MSSLGRRQLPLNLKETFEAVAPDLRLKSKT